MEKFTRKTLTLAAGIMLSVMSANAQTIRKGYVDFGANTGSNEFHTLLNSWKPGSQVSGDDNFFISRQKPRVRFRNVNTQVRQNLTETNDKNLIAWVPYNNPTFNALPDGVFDSEVFSMWSYVTHWGDWTAPLGRIPAALMDVAHKNGIGVSGVASIPNASLASTSFYSMMSNLGSLDVDNAAKFMRYYGIDGLGYNSEFSTTASVMKGVRSFHTNLYKKLKPVDPLYESFWYDGTNDAGVIYFDQGLANHNKQNFGAKGSECFSLFFNYNWTSRLPSAVTYAENTLKRDPLDVYAGINMQGGQPANLPWNTLGANRISIGLWGAHSNNMWWESRDELGSSDDDKQNAYLERTERYFTGGTRNPANCPEVMSGHQYNAKNYKWHGISTFMTARSALNWDLAEEPFMTHFNLGNGKFFNLNGERQNSKPWYNVGVQDYLPTWHFWFANKLLGRNASDVPANGLDAAFTWDDAYFGGSTIRISGTSADEYLHLFKTKYTLKAGDVITFKYKVNEGSTDLDLVLSAEGSEANGVSYKVGEKTYVPDVNKWVEKTFVVGSDFDGKDLALVALHFKNAEKLDLLLGEFSIVRGTAATPATPQIASASMLYNSKEGMDAKIIFNMPNDKAAGEPCYNQDVKTSYFRLYAQEEGQEPVLMGATSSWAGLYYSIPVKKANAKVRLGVAAVSLDQKTASDIAWSEYLTPASYYYGDDIQISKTTIKPGEEFTLSYVDAEHPAATWEIQKDGTTVKSGNGNSWTCDGLSATGNYDLKVTGNEYTLTYNNDGAITGQETKTSTRTFSNYIQVTSASTGALPEIYSLAANGQEEGDVTLKVGEKVNMTYTGRNADGAGSQGVDLKESRFGVKASDLGLVGAKSFSVSFWVKLNSITTALDKDGNPMPTCLFNVYNKKDGWPKTDWGWIWTGLAQDGSFDHYNFRGSDRSNNKELHYKFPNSKLTVGGWTHVTMSFDYNTSGELRSDLFINGVKQTVTYWDRTGGSKNYTEPTYQGDIYNITNGMYLCIGGPLYQRAGIDGVIDNVLIWDKATTEADAKTAMGDLSEKNLPAGTLAFWDFEKSADSDHSFLSVGSKAGVKAGVQDMNAQGSEGQAEIVNTPPTYSVGCPFVSGSTYKVETKPSWTAKNATVTDVKGNGEAGSASVSFRTDGIYDVTLTLENALGSASKTYSVIKVGTTDGVNAVEGTELKAYTVGEDAVVEFAEDGAYEVAVYTTAGEQVARKAAQLSAGNVVNVHLAKAGIYVLNVKKDGKTVRTVKLIRK